MKKLLAVLLALVMVFSFAACGDKKEEVKEEAKVWPEGLKEVQVLVPQAVGAMLDQSTRIMVDFLNASYPDTNFVVVNEEAGGGNKAGITLAKAPGDGSIIMAHGAGAIIQYYSDTWDYNLADLNTFKSIAGNVGQLQPSGGVFLINAQETRFHDIPTLVDYVKAHPGELNFAFGNGTPHEIRMKLITEYYGISDMVNWQPLSTNEIRSGLQADRVEHNQIDVGILTETQAVADIRGGKVVGILNSLLDHEHTDDIKDVLINVPIVTDYVTDRVKAEGLVCAWPMTIYGPASMSDEMCKQINAACCKIADDAEYMARIKALGSSNTYQIFTFEEINELTQIADQQIRDVFEAMGQLTK